MQGKILDYNNEFKSGLIRSKDGNKYRFSIDDCKSAITPKAGAEVDFEPIVIFVVFAGIANLVDYLQKQKEQQRITDLKNQCNNNSAKACCEYSTELKYYSGEHTTKARNEALAKGCQLGNKDACREGEYYKEGCALQDGESCYILAQNTVRVSSILMCANNPKSSWCESSKNEEKNAKEYYQKACQYGYSQGCLQK